MLSPACASQDRLQAWRAGTDHAQTVAPALSAQPSGWWSSAIAPLWAQERCLSLQGHPPLHPSLPLSCRELLTQPPRPFRCAASDRFLSSQVHPVCPQQHHHLAGERLACPAPPHRLLLMAASCCRRTASPPGHPAVHPLLLLTAVSCCRCTASAPATTPAQGSAGPTTATTTASSGSRSW